MRVAFFDRDGTIIEDVPDKEWGRVESPVWIRGAMDTLEAVRGKGFEIIIVTNQYIINEGYITAEQYEHMNRQVLAALRERGIPILDVFHCPHARDAGCCCIKPNTGMIEQATERYPPIELAESFMIGDSDVDVQLATNVGIRGFGIRVQSDDPAVTTLERVADLLKYI
ncbi:D-glycero-D-manno-heptose 1,7-bisphosphate phosphatase [Geomicrobium sp. JCM 19037]|uniref:D-glycero-alpha-D-manno-heptose-1,7-bisphosphate 7-phosphatase n=1 Tax=Geomicrobium sp. JCM 19037 TaxID=1460634 RepID=UPI00045F43D6|nr:HAD-IIIA family hydrolase [Geomicrobium sp. JCM 19037]GAK02168.1 D-glycero-D-manno-heptose 1,7-bisphosphate phosphatase [Geomicrobium sp. JCM 19037]